MLRFAWKLFSLEKLFPSLSFTGPSEVGMITAYKSTNIKGWKIWILWNRWMFEVSTLLTSHSRDDLFIFSSEQWGSFWNLEVLKSCLCLSQIHVLQTEFHCHTFKSTGTTNYNEPCCGFGKCRNWCISPWFHWQWVSFWDYIEYQPVLSSTKEMWLFENINFKLLIAVNRGVLS